jgi:hypothetical protein
VEQHVFTGGAETEKYGVFATALSADGDRFFTVGWRIPFIISQIFIPVSGDLQISISLSIIYENIIVYARFSLKKIISYIIIMVSESTSEISFSAESAPDAKIAPIVVGGAVFVGKALVGGAVGAAASWGTTRILDNRFPAKK